jgi:hypothetical protein
MIINYLDKIVQKIVDYDNYINQRLDNYFKITDEMREESNNSYWMETKIFMFENRRVIGTVILFLFILQILCYFNGETVLNENIKCSSVINKPKLQKGGQGTLSGLASAYKASSAARGASLEAAAKSGKMKALNKGAYNMGKYGKGKLMAAKEMGFEVADRLKAVAGVYFEILYSLAMVFLLGVTLGPIIVLLIIFLICYKLFKKKMIAIKRY